MMSDYVVKVIKPGNNKVQLQLNSLLLKVGMNNKQVFQVSITTHYIMVMCQTTPFQELGGQRTKIMVFITLGLGPFKRKSILIYNFELSIRELPN